MAILRGTAAPETINGVGTDNDTIYGLGGNDIINGDVGNDSLYGEAAFYQGKYYLFTDILSWTAAQAQATSLGGNLVTVNDAAENQWLISNFGGQGNLWIGLTDQSVEGTFVWANGENAAYRNWLSGQPTNATGLEDYVSLSTSGTWSALTNATTQRGIIEIAFSSVVAGNNTLKDSANNDTLKGGAGNDTLYGGFGNDFLDGGADIDTADYSTLGQAITLLPTGGVNKGSAGIDQLVSIEKIIAPTGQANLIDAFSATNLFSGATINANLSTQSVTINAGLPAPLSFTVTNFVNVVGTANNDVITGDGGNNSLVGGAGNDTINGGDGNDTISAGVGNDLLNGGGGNDLIFGDLTTSYFTYNGKVYLLSSAGTWTQAQASAVSVGGNLVTVNDAAENQWLVNTFGGTEGLWIGLNDEAVEGTFRWVNGEAVTYTNWNPGQPDNLGNQDYAWINFVSPGKWDDAGIGSVFRGIIEIAASSNDTIIGSTGNDNINGGFGTDTADYSSLTQAITLLPTGVVNKGTNGTDQLIDIEAIIGATGQTNLIDTSTATNLFSGATINADLSNKSIKVNAGPTTTLSFDVTNFVNVVGTNNNDIITGDGGNNSLVGGAGNDTINGGAGGNDTIIAGAGNDRLIGNNGNDTLNGGADTDTADYSNLGQAITLLPKGVVNKGTAGTDQLIDVEAIIGATGKANIIDNSSATGITTIKADLANQSLIVNADGLPNPLSFTVTNFVNVIGTNNNDTIAGDGNNNSLIGGAGDDTIIGNGGNDTINGGTGDEQIFGDFTSASTTGGNDIIIGSTGNDTINGGAGIDTVDYSSFTEVITLSSGGFIDKGLSGTDKIVDVEKVIGASGQANTIDASTGTSTTTSLTANLATNSLTVNGLPVVGSLSFTVQNFLNVYGTNQADKLTGNNLANELVGNAGNDTITGNGGDDILDGGDYNDQLFGGDGNDQLYGGDGSDILQGDNGNDLLSGDLGNDTLRGNNGDDFLDGGEGNDSLLGGANNDTLFGDAGNDILNGESGNDLLYGDDGSDRLYGGDGIDELNGGTGKDTLYGGNGNDTIFGNEDNDVIYGEAGDDLLNGGKGIDLLYGGLNNDTFVIALGNGSDQILDFQDTFDKIGLSGGLTVASLTILGLGTNTLIRSGSETLATLQNVSSGLITTADFVIV